MTNEEVSKRMSDLGFTFQYGISPVRFRLRDGAMAVPLPGPDDMNRFRLVIYSASSIEVGDL